MSVVTIHTHTCSDIYAMVSTCSEARSTKSFTALLNISLHLWTCWPPLDRPVNSYAVIGKHNCELFTVNM